MILGSYSLGAIPLASMRIKQKKVAKKNKPLPSGEISRIDPRGEIAWPKNK